MVGDDDDEVWMGGGLDLLCSVGGSVSSREEITPAELFLPASSFGGQFSIEYQEAPRAWRGTKFNISSL